MMSTNNSKYYKHFKTLSSLRLPRPLRILSLLIVFAFVLILTLLIVVPWVQTASGTGKVTALNPEDRIQSINAFVSGRIGKWYIRDGDFVKKGDPIVEIIDNDPNFVSRLTAKREAIKTKLMALQKAADTAELDYNRQKSLHLEGLSARRQKEQALIQFENAKSRVASVKAELNNAEVSLSRQATQLIKAPRDGTITNINAGDVATFVNTGAVLATFLPDGIEQAVELYVNGLDAPLIHAGREVRLMFEGWPAVQFSGWPSFAVGTFEGVVHTIDPALSANGRIRILVKPNGNQNWPSSKFLRYGAQARGWVLLDTVALGYEIWRQFNNFPPEFSEQAESGSNAK